MAIMKLDHVSVVVDDLAAAIKFFTVLGMTIELPPPEIAELPLLRPRGAVLPLVIIPTLSLFAIAFARLAREAKARRRR